MRSAWRSRFFWVALAGLSLLELAVLAARNDATYPVDDAYISFRYARNWAAGNGLAFNPGERAEGYSNFLWIALVAAADRCGLTPPLAARWLAVLATIVSLALLLGRASPTGRASRIATLLGAAIFASSPLTYGNVLSGLEAPLTAALWLASIVLLARERFEAAALCLTLLALARPEGALLGSLVAVASCAQAAIRAPAGAAVSLRGRAAAFLVYFVLPVGLYFTWRLSYFGHFVPNSVVAKQGEAAGPALRASFAYVLSFLRSHWPLCVAAALGAFSLRRSGAVERYAALAAVAILALNLAVGSGDPYLSLSRYLYPALPLLLLVAVSPVERLFAEGRDARWTDRLPAYGAVLLLAVQGALFAPAVSEALGSGRLRSGLSRLAAQDDTPHSDPALAFRLGQHGEARFLRSAAHPDDLLAAAEIGIAPYYSGVRVLDTFGLVSPEIARSPGPPGGRATPDMVFGARPAFISLKVPASCMCGGIPADAALQADPRLRLGYQLAAAYPSWDRWILILQRRPEPLLEIVSDLVKSFSPAEVRFEVEGQPWRADAALAAQLTASGGVLATVDLAAEGPPLARRLAEDDDGRIDDTDLARRIVLHLGRSQRVLMEHPRAGERVVVRYPLRIDGPTALVFGLGTPPSAWTPETPGDGVEFEVRVAAGAERLLLFHAAIDPKHLAADRRFTRHAVDLSRFSGQRVELQLITLPGAAQDDRADWAFWIEPLVLRPAAAGLDEALDLL
jgi:hypothetical protein